MTDPRAEVEALRGYEDSIGRFVSDPIGTVVPLAAVLAILDRPIPHCHSAHCWRLDDEDNYSWSRRFLNEHSGGV